MGMSSTCTCDFWVKLAFMRDLQSTRQMVLFLSLWQHVGITKIKNDNPMTTKH